MPVGFVYIYASCARPGAGTHTTYTISAWAFFVAYPCTWAMRRPEVWDKRQVQFPRFFYQYQKALMGIEGTNKLTWTIQQKNFSLKA